MREGFGDAGDNPALVADGEAQVPSDEFGLGARSSSRDSRKPTTFLALRCPAVRSRAISIKSETTAALVAFW
jgi:hypothetical protein